MAGTYTTIALVRAATGMTNSTNISDTYVDGKIVMAEGLINGKIGDVYVTPLTTVPDFIKALALNISCALLYIDQYGQETEGLGIDGDKMLNTAMKTLTDIQKQNIKIRDATGEEITRRSLRKPESYPNNTTTDAETTVRSFTKDQIF